MLIRLFSALLVVSLLLPGCGSPNADSGSTLSKDILIYARGADSRDLDPVSTTDGESVKVITNICETLVTFSPDGSNVIPRLAEKWDVSDDGKTWTFHLHTGVKFHDGTDFNAEAVKFSLERHILPLREGKGFPYSGSYGMIESIDASDPAKVVFTLNTVSAVFLRNLAMFPASIVSPASVEKYGDDFGTSEGGIAGTGAFKLDAWKKDVHVKLTRNDDYRGEKAKVKGVVFMPVKENAIRVERFLNGEFHMIDNIPFESLDQIRDDANATLLSRQGMNMCYMGMNMNKEPFNNADVRRAIAHAVDLDRMHKLAYHGQGTKGVVPLPPTVPFFNKDIQPYEYSVEKAKELLKNAGFADGFSCTLHAPGNPRPYAPDPQAMAQVIKEDLKKIGIDVTISSPDWTTYIQHSQAGEHEMMILGWSTDNGDPDNFLYELFHSSKAVEGSSQNIAFFKSPVFDRFVDSAKVTVNDDERREAYAKAQEILHQAAPVVTLMYTDIYAGLQKGVSGYNLHPIGLYRLDTVEIK
jgi:peptide/nickel transport system substrate-binding protein